MPDLLVVEHRDGRTYAVPAAHFRKELEPQGFKAVRYESGKSYEPPTPKAESTAAAKKDDTK